MKLVDGYTVFFEIEDGHTIPQEYEVLGLPRADPRCKSTIYCLTLRPQAPTARIEFAAMPTNAVVLPRVSLLAQHSLCAFGEAAASAVCMESLHTVCG